MTGDDSALRWATSPPPPAAADTDAVSGDVAAPCALVCGALGVATSPDALPVAACPGDALLLVLPRREAARLQAGR
jgi:hypothetical protein